MKVCKKCKKQVANKTKICKFCGADVTKCKVIKNNNTQSNNKTKKQPQKTNIKKDEPKTITKVKEQSVEKELKQETTKEIKQKEETVKKVKPETNKKDKLKETKTPKKTIKSKTKKKTKHKKSDNKFIIVINKIKEFFVEKLKVFLPKLKKGIKVFFEWIVKLLKKIKPAVIFLSKGLWKLIKIISKGIVFVFKKIWIGIKKIFTFIIFILKNIGKFLLIAIKKIGLAIKKVALILTKTVKKISHAIKVSIVVTAKAIAKAVVFVFKYPIKFLKYIGTEIAKSIALFFKKINLKPILIIIIIICVFGGASCIFASQYKKNNPIDIEKIITPEKATNEKLFSIGDIITYKGVNYQITKVETSEGNSYKSPKKGNIFLIIYISITNNTGDKVQYSYNNWTMSNSKDEEDKLLFSSVNTGSALYTGELAIGGTKVGSIIFEQPKNDKKLRLNYYELKKDKKTGLETIDENKKAFSVSIKIPNKTEEENIENK